MDSFYIWHKWSLSLEGLSRVTFFSESGNWIFGKFFGLDLEKKIYSSRWIICVAYNDLWPWPISSRSFGLGLENRVRYVASTVLTLNVRGPSYLGLTRSLSWLLLSWLLASPGHQRPRYWLCVMGKSLSYLRKDFNHLCHINVEERYKM